MLPPDAPFADFPGPRPVRSARRQAITAVYRRPEPACVAELLPKATLPPALAAATEKTARHLVAALRAKPQGWGVDGLIHEYTLSSPEGVALMCLAEALLRIPDKATRDALIRDKIADGDWHSHLGHDTSLFVNATTWGLLITGKLSRAVGPNALSSALTRLVAHGGEPLIRQAVDYAIRLMGERFVTGQTIAEAIANSRKMAEAGFTYSYDMLGEAAITADDSRRYHAAYETAIHAIGTASAGRGIHAGPGISIKLSALHPRYGRAQAERVMTELLPQVTTLAKLAKAYDIGLNIDAEEADRLDLSLDLLEGLCRDAELAGWNGLGLAVQAYGKRCPRVLDQLIELARHSSRRLMVRLVKGAYWDAEIKRAQVDGLDDYPVFTRKVHTDLSYLACARQMLDAPDAVFPQFATHNAQTLASLYHLAGDDFRLGRYEFQCLHGMGEALYSEVVGPLARPCRIYAPVGTHETLLAYLVRRLLENGANSSFVNRINDKTVSVDDLVTAPAVQAAAITPLGAPHPLIALPSRLFGLERRNSAGIDLSNDDDVDELWRQLVTHASSDWRAEPLLATPRKRETTAQRWLRNPADHRDVVGSVVEAEAADIAHAFDQARVATAWAFTAPRERAECLTRAAHLFEQNMPMLVGLIVREAGRTVVNAITELREAVDFLRYYAAQIRDDFDSVTHRPLGPVVCISPWNFPLAIFIGQVAAGLAAGNAVLAKPAEQTPLIACESARLLHQAGIPPQALQVLPGDGDVGAALVGHPETRLVMFTGSTQVARLIQRQLAERLSPEGALIPLIAETGGQNAMIVDSSALTEQVVGDVIASAFDSAGQRCSALRLLCLQDDIADKTLAMLKGAMAELNLGRPDRLSVDIGPVISDEARAAIALHVEHMRTQGCAIHSLKLPAQAAHGTFVAPTLIEIAHPDQLEHEIFGPVLHVVRFHRDHLPQLIARINASGHGLTFGLHTRIDAKIQAISQQIRAGNVYVNRNIIGAVVGVQPFGGHGLSGTGPKAGGPLYLHRLLTRSPGSALRRFHTPPPAPQALALRDWLRASGQTMLAERCDDDIGRSRLGLCLDLPGPVGERNTYSLRPRGHILMQAGSRDGLLRQLSAIFATGNQAIIEGADELVASLPPELRRHIARSGGFTAILAEGRGEELLHITRRAVAMDGPIIPVHAVDDAARQDYCLDWLLEERCLSVNTAAAGGNASLVNI